MAFLNLDAVVTKVYDLLRQDAKTAGLDWYNGRRPLERIQKFPAGNVDLGSGTVLPFTIPGGEENPIRVAIELWYTHQEGGTKLAQLLRNGIDDVAAVLINTPRLAGSGGWDVGLSYAELAGVAWRVLVAPDHTTPLAVALIEAQIRIIPTGS